MTERDIFIAALQHGDPARRQAYLDEACTGQPELRRQVEHLLRLYKGAGSFLEKPAATSPATGAFQQHAAAPASSGEAPGTVIGPYQLLEPIGEGGMGSVWMAQQTEPVKRLVAVKLIKAGMDSKQVIARFEAERQALALMDHANIARVLDAGTTSAGRPYFVMDLVKGVAITRYCDEHHLTPRQRLELFLPVCQAVQHAHQKGIIHRDLKPSNVLVALYDGQPVPKVIDFGVAKAAGQTLTDKTLVTGFGAIVGTLEYMSPEQAEVNQLDIDTRSDIYSLGVLLYELLAGSPPFTRQEKIGLLDMLRVIREQEPTKPSAKLSTADGLPTLAADRGTEPRKLAKLVRGELDWIVMKALEKDRSRRYATANGFARDVQRYLADEPVLAGPPGAGYRFRKFVQRNKGRVLAASLVLVALLAGMAGTTWGMIDADQARQDAVSAQLAEKDRAEREHRAMLLAKQSADEEARAKQEEARAKQEAQRRLEQIVKGAELLAWVFEELDPGFEEMEGESLRVLLGRRLAEALRQLEGETIADPLLVARLQHVLGSSLRALGHLDQAEVMLVKARQTREQLLGTDHLYTVGTKYRLAGLYRTQGKYALAETLLNEVVAICTARLGGDHLDTLECKDSLAVLYRLQGKYPAAETLCQTVLKIRIAKLGSQHLDTVHTKQHLAFVYVDQGKYAAAEALYQEVLQAAKLKADHPIAVSWQCVLAGSYVGQGKYGQAQTLYQEVLKVYTLKLGADHPVTLQAKHMLAMVYRLQGKLGPAETLCKEALEGLTAKLGRDHPDTLTSMAELASLYVIQDKNARSKERHAWAEALLSEVVQGRTAKLGRDHPDTLFSMNSLATVWWNLKKLDQSVPLFEETLQLSKGKLGPDHLTTLTAQANLGVNYRDIGRLKDALVLLEEVYHKGRTNPQLAWVGKSLLSVYVRTGNAKGAVALVTEQVAAARKQFAPDDPQFTAELAFAGRALLDVKAYAEAEAVLRENLTLRQKRTPNYWGTYNARSQLGAALLGQQKYAEAEPLLLEGYAGIKEREATIPAEFKVRLIEALERLVRLYEAWGKKDKADEWRKKLEDHRQAEKKAAQ
jgi:serine/threonine protein kinase